VAHFYKGRPPVFPGFWGVSFRQSECMSAGTPSPNAQSCDGFNSLFPDAGRHAGGCQWGALPNAIAVPPPNVLRYPISYPFRGLSLQEPSDINTADCNSRRRANTFLPVWLLRGTATCVYRKRNHRGGSGGGPMRRAATQAKL